MTILVVEDDPHLLAMVEQTLAREGHRVLTATHGNTARTMLDEETVDVVVLDLNLPDVDGLHVLVEIVRESQIPVVVTSGRRSEEERVLGLHVGAVDYLTKPYSPRELALRVAGAARRGGEAANEAKAPMVFGDLVIDLRSREVTLTGNSVSLPRREFDLLATLASEPRRVFSKEELLERVWRSKPEFQQVQTVTEHVRRLRKKIEEQPEEPKRICTVSGVGYRFEP